MKYATSNDVAAFIAEPVMGEGGIIVPPANYFKEVKKVLDHYGILFIADEVQCGFARTGKMFAIDYYGVTPDIIVTAKGIADGFPLSAYTTRPEIAAAYTPGDHLSTFGGNPVSCAAALANIEFMQKTDLPGHTTEVGNYALGKLRELAKTNPIIGDVRGLGLMIGVELVKDAQKTPASAEAEAVQGILLQEWNADRSGRRRKCGSLPATIGHHQAADRSGNGDFREGAAGSGATGACNGVKNPPEAKDRHPEKNRQRVSLVANYKTAR